MEKWICKTCGTQFPASEQPPGACPICLDERQYVGYNGQEWTTLAQMQQDGFRKELQEHESHMVGMGTTPTFAIGGRAIHCMTGVVPVEARPAAETVFIKNLARGAEAAAKHDVTLLIEPLNPRDRAGYFLSRVEHAADIVEKVGAPNVRIPFDFYHIQIVGGDLITRFEKYQPLIGHAQIAAVPTRGEPDEGEINYSAVFAAMDRLGYDGFIGCEYKPRARTEDGLGWAKPSGLAAKRS